MSSTHRCTCKPQLDRLALTAADIGRLLGISTRQVWAWDAGGQLGPEPVKMSERITRWDAAEIRQWWAVCRVAGRPIGRREWLVMKAENGWTP